MNYAAYKYIYNIIDVMTPGIMIRVRDNVNDLVKLNGRT